jgi:hypothetical protein
MDSSTSRSRRLAPAASLSVAGLVVAAAGIVIQIASGADYLTIPRACSSCWPPQAWLPWRPAGAG